jgi:hypothetical protein
VSSTTCSILVEDFALLNDACGGELVYCFLALLRKTIEKRSLLVSTDVGKSSSYFSLYDSLPYIIFLFDYSFLSIDSRLSDSTAVTSLTSFLLLDPRLSRLFYSK